MKRVFVAALLLAGCDSGVELTNASLAEVATAAEAAVKPKPGQWETTTELVAFDMGQVGIQDPRIAEVFKKQIGQKQNVSACLTPEQSEKRLFGDIAPNAGAFCRFAKFTMKNGQIDATMACRNAGGSRLEVRQAGDYGADAVNIMATVKRTAPNGTPEGGLTTRVTSRRTGDCAGEKK